MKPVTQEVFKLPGCPENFNWAAVDEDTQLWAYRQKPKIDPTDDRWSAINMAPKLLGTGYDNTNWMNSAIEREIV